MDIRDFKRIAKVTEDNRDTAAKNWGKTWGLDFWWKLWAYRTYEYKNLKYKSGTVTMRHYGYTHTECYIDGEKVTTYKFKKALENLEYTKPKTRRTETQMSLF